MKTRTFKETLLALIFLTTLAGYLRFINITTFWSVIDDEGIYTAVANMISKGLLPYVDLHLPQPPVFHVLLAATLKLMGSSLAVARSFNAFIGTITLPIIFFLTYKAYNKKVAFVSTAFYAIYPGLVTETKIATPEPMTMLFVSISVLTAIIWKKEKKKWFLFLSGFFAGLSLLTKYLSVIILAIFFVFIFIEVFKKNQSNKFTTTMKSSLGTLKPYLIGLLIPIALFLLIMLILGTLQHLYVESIWWQSNRFPFTYEKRGSFARGILVSFPMIVFFATTGSFFEEIERFVQKDWLRFGVPISIVISLFLEFFVLEVFLTHYFYPAFLLLIIVGSSGFTVIVTKAFKFYRLSPSNLTRKIIVVLAFSLLAISPLLFGYVYNVNYPDLKFEYIFDRPQYGFMSIELEEEVANYIRTVTQPNDKIFTTVGLFGFLSDREIVRPNVPYWKHQGFFGDVFSYEYQTYRPEGAMQFTPSVIEEALQLNEPKVILYAEGTNTDVDRLLWFGFKAKGEWHEGIYRYVLKNYRPTKKFQDKVATILVFERALAEQKLIAFNNFVLNGSSSAEDIPIWSVETRISETKYQANNINVGCNLALKLSYEFVSNETENIRVTLPVNLNLTNCNYAAVTIEGDNSGNQLWFDLIDSDGKSQGTMKYVNFNGSRTELFLIQDYTEVDIENITNIRISLDDDPNSLGSNESFSGNIVLISIVCF